MTKKTNDQVRLAHCLTANCSNLKPTETYSRAYFCLWSSKRTEMLDCWTSRHEEWSTDKVVDCSLQLVEPARLFRDTH